MSERDFRIRAANRDEAISLRIASREELTFLEGLFSPKPKHALIVETLDGRFAGSAFYSINKNGFGYVDIIYVLRSYKGTGAAKLLYKAVVQALKNEGCDKILALVIDDNAPSFKSFENVGLHTSSICQITRAWGPKAIGFLFASSPALLAAGCRIVANIPKQKTSKFPFAWVLKVLLCSLVFMLMSLAKGQFTLQLLWSIPAAFCALSVGLLGQILGNHISQRPFSLYQDSAGLLTSLLVSLSGGPVFPPQIHLYPKEWNNDYETKRQLGLSAFFSQILTLAAMVFLFFCQEVHPFLGDFKQYLWIYCICNTLPFFPFSVFGTKSIWHYSRALSIIMAFMNTISIIILR